MNYVALVNIKGVVKIVSLEYFLIAERENSVLYIANEIQCSDNWTITPLRLQDVDGNGNGVPLLRSRSHCVDAGKLRYGTSNVKLQNGGLRLFVC